MNFYVLAGGKSRRMGRNKALLCLNGKTLIEWVLAAIPQEHTTKIITNSSEAFTGFGYDIISDTFVGVGPIAGVHAGLRDSSGEFSFFLGCDLPFVTSALVARILSGHQGQDIFGVRNACGPQPLCTIYSRNCLPVIERQIYRKEHSLHALFGKVRCQFIEIDNPDALLNVNTEQDWMAAREIMGRRKGVPDDKMSVSQKP